MRSGRSAASATLREAVSRRSLFSNPMMGRLCASPGSAASRAIFGFRKRGLPFSVGPMRPLPAFSLAL